MKLEWTQTNEYLCASTPNFKFEKKLAMFDLDNTLIKPKIGKFGKGRGFPVNASDWKFTFPNVKQTLINYFESGFSIIIISNQGGISLGKQTFDEWTNKLNQICTELNIELYVFCSVDHNKYRKPYPTWFNEFVPTDIQENLNRSVSFYCGDACGRNGDFSDTDYKFALNCMIKFKTPENFFVGEIEKIPKIKYPDIFKKNTFDFNFVPTTHKEMILMVGYQGSGKSYIANKINMNYGYAVINQDLLKSAKKCILDVEENMKKAVSVIIDKTNPDKETRKIWIDLAKKYNYSVRAILMTTSRELSKHNNYFRHITANVKIIQEIAYRTYNSKFVKPELTEGFTEILEAHCSSPKNHNYYLFLY